VAATTASADEAPDDRVISDGKSDYEWHCRSCHGADGKGNGPMAKMLMKPPADLTAIAKANGGVFPFWRVYRVIDGQKPVPGHETFQMPGFWKRFRAYEKEWSSLAPHARILELTHYLQSLQEE
jgi:mono/diheme cytochrome c family protein